MRCMSEKAEIARKGLSKLILLRYQKKMKERESCTEIYHLLREYINHHEQNVGRNSNSKGHSARNEEMQKML